MRRNRDEIMDYNKLEILLHRYNKCLVWSILTYAGNGTMRDAVCLIGHILKHFDLTTEGEGRCLFKIG
jgi:hypothetical protein